MRNANLSLTLLFIITICYDRILTEAFSTTHITPKGKGVVARSSCEISVVVAMTSSTVDYDDNLNNDIIESSISRRSYLLQKAATVSFAALGIDLLSGPSPAVAKTDCMADCLKNCKLIAPKDPAYCNGSCSEYCAQEDRTDGLSGSVSSTGGETGILGLGTVSKGEDKPPGFKVPGLDFNSEKGRKLIGY